MTMIDELVIKAIVLTFIVAGVIIGVVVLVDQPDTGKKGGIKLLFEATVVPIIYLLAYALRPFFKLGYKICTKIVVEDDTVKRNIEKEEDIPPSTPSSSKEQEFVVKVTQYRDEIQQLNKLSKQLPKEYENHITSISSSTINIIKAMTNDPRDIVPGQLFLDRYLNSTLQMINSFCQINIQDSTDNTSQEIRESTLKFLESLNSAFEQQYQNLLSNDKDDLIVNIKTFKKILHFDGFSNGGEK